MECNGKKVFDICSKLNLNKNEIKKIINYLCEKHYTSIEEIVESTDKARHILKYIPVQLYKEIRKGNIKYANEEQFFYEINLLWIQQWFEQKSGPTKKDKLENCLKIAIFPTILETVNDNKVAEKLLEWLCKKIIDNGYLNKIEFKPKTSIFSEINLLWIQQWFEQKSGPTKKDKLENCLKIAIFPTILETVNDNKVAEKLLERLTNEINTEKLEDKIEFRRNESNFIRINTFWLREWLEENEGHYFKNIIYNELTKTVENEKIADNLFQSLESTIKGIKDFSKIDFGNKISVINYINTIWLKEWIEKEDGEVFYNHLNEKVYKTILNEIGDKNEANELFQDTLSKITQKIKAGEFEFRGAAQFFSYIHITWRKNNNNNYKEKNNHINIDEIDLESPDKIEDSGSLNGMRTNRERDFYQKLPKKFRPIWDSLKQRDKDVLLMRYCEGYKDEYIAKKLKTSNQNIRKIRSRAMIYLKGHL